MKAVLFCESQLYNLTGAGFKYSDMSVDDGIDSLTF